jgi:hypothetical protein
MLKRHFPNMKSILSSFAGGNADLHIDEGDLIKVGNTIELNVLATPGHTDGKKKDRVKKNYSNLRLCKLRFTQRACCFHRRCASYPWLRSN